jgi:hypothetical protein
MSERQFKLPVAVHSTLDDANLSAEEFRVMAHICRRCGDEENGRHCDSAIGTIAKICRLHPDTVRKAIARLVELKWVSIIDRPGRTKVHVAHFPNPSGLKVGAGSEVGGMVSREGYGLDVAPPTGFKGGPPPGFKGDEGIPLRDTKKVTPGDYFPLPFQSDEFKGAWNDWKQHRIEKRKPITPLSAKKSLLELSAMGEARAIAAINHSIANGWQGIFEPTGPAVASPPAVGAITIGGRTFKP